MKLYLSSYRVPTPEELFKLLPKPPTECSVAIIPNAKDYKLPEERAKSLDDLIYDLAKFGFKTDVVDLREYDDDPDNVRAALVDHEVLWLAGGNTFMLRSELQRSGLDQVILGLLQDGMIYCGESAGAIVAGRTLEGSEDADDPELADKKIVAGLGLLDKIIVPHADSPDYVEYINKMKKTHGNDQDVIYLNDNQALVVQ